MIRSARGFVGRFAGVFATGPVVRYPETDAFSWMMPYITKIGDEFVVTIEPESLAPVTTATLYVSTTGADANNGSTPELAKRSITGAIAAMVEPTTIYVAAGTYDHSRHWNGTLPGYDMRLIATGGRVRMTAASLALLTWTQNGTYPAVWQATRSAITHVVDEADENEDGFATRLVSRASIADVDANPGSYHYAANVVYVRTFDSRQPTNSLNESLQCFLGVNLGAINNADRSIYIEGIDFLGGNDAGLRSVTASRLVTVGCTFRYPFTNGLETDATDEVFLFDCAADEGKLDGFNYHTTSRVLEVNCSARGNGHDGGSINNGSSMHDGGTIVRVNGTYRRNSGANIAEANQSPSWNLGVTLADTKAPLSSGQINAYTDGEMWIDGGTLSENTVDLNADTGATIRTRNTTYAITGGAGVVSDY